MDEQRDLLEASAERCECKLPHVARNGVCRKCERPYREPGSETRVVIYED